MWNKRRKLKREKGVYELELKDVFKRVNELTEKYQNLTKEEVKELRELSKGLSHECSEILYSWGKWPG